MIGTSTFEYVWVVFWVVVLHSIGPICILYTIVSSFISPSLHLPIIIETWAILETAFYLLTYVYRKHYIQRPASHPPPLPKDEREQLYRRCQESTHDSESFISQWFLNAPLDAIKRENVKEFTRWAFLNTAEIDPSHDQEVENYVDRYEDSLGKKFEAGRGNAECMRLTIDKVNTLHRSLTWYMCIYVVDILTHTYLRFHNYQFYRAASMRQSFKVIPPRPHTFVDSNKSPSRSVNYWYHPHTSKTELPILFIHGIGVGLYPYMEFLKEINQNRTADQGTIGVLAIEILGVSSRITAPVLAKEEMCRQIRCIIDHHGFDKFVVASHSYGSVISTYLLKTPDLADRISSVILIDPVSILLHQPDVAYNFTARRPKQANEWLVWYFGSQDMGVAHTLSRTFFWSENILWKEDMCDHRVVIFLCERDTIINAPRVLRYLQSDDHGEKDQQVTTTTAREKRKKETITATAPQSKNEKRQSNLHHQHHQTTKSRQQLSGDKDRNDDETYSTLNPTTTSKSSSSLHDLDMDVVWCPGMDHGQIFDQAPWRKLLKTKIMYEISLASSASSSPGSSPPTVLS